MRNAIRWLRTYDCYDMLAQSVFLISAVSSAED